VTTKNLQYTMSWVIWSTIIWTTS